MRLEYEIENGEQSIGKKLIRTLKTHRTNFDLRILRGTSVVLLLFESREKAMNINKTFGKTSVRAPLPQTPCIASKPNDYIIRSFNNVTFGRTA